MTNPTPATIPEKYIDLLERPLFAMLATTLPNGTPQVTPIWFHYEDGYVYFNSAKGRLKDRAIRANPYVAIAVLDPENGYRYLQLRGPVVEMDEEQGRAHINYLSKRYTGNENYPGPAEEIRVRYKLVPERVDTH